MALRRNRTFAVIGLGTFGSTIALELERLGNEVLGIDRSEERVGAVVDRLAHAIIADARDERALAEAGLSNYDVAVVAIGEELESSILCTLALKTIGVKAVWVKATSLTHCRILTALGADRIIQPEQEIGLHIAQSLNTPLVLDYISLSNGYYVVNVDVPASLAGTSIADLRLMEKHDVRFLGIMRGARYIPGDDPGAMLKEKDQLLLLGRQEDLRRLEAKL